MSADEFTTFDELDLPDTIYKYRSWSDRYHKRILTHNEVFMSPPKSFEDELDCKIPVRYDLLTNADIFQKYYLEALQSHPFNSHEWCLNFARDWTSRGLLKDARRLKDLEAQFFEQLNSKIGILSLTANPASKFMWDKYADGCKGICVGFDPKIMFKFLGGGGEVKYFDGLPIIWPSPKHDLGTQMYLQTFSKLKKWEFEEEYRTQKFSYYGLLTEHRKITLPNEAYKEVILGSLIPSEYELEIRQILAERLQHVSVMRASPELK